MAKTVSKQQIKDAEVIKDTTKVTQNVNEKENAQQQEQEDQQIKVGWKDNLDKKVAKYRPAAIKVAFCIGAAALTGVVVKKVFFKSEITDRELMDIVKQSLLDISDDYESLNSFSE